MLNLDDVPDVDGSVDPTPPTDLLAKIAKIEKLSTFADRLGSETTGVSSLAEKAAAFSRQFNDLGPPPIVIPEHVSAMPPPAAQASQMDDLIDAVGALIDL